MISVDIDKLRAVARQAESLVDELSGATADHAQEVCDRICELLIAPKVASRNETIEECKALLRDNLPGSSYMFLSEAIGVLDSALKEE